MARVWILTEGDSIVYKSGAISSHELLMTRGEQRILSMVRRSVEDAERIERGEDPERPSEKAMRMADEAEDRKAEDKAEGREDDYPPGYDGR